MEQCFITSCTLRASTLPIAILGANFNIVMRHLDRLGWVDGGKDYYCTQQLYLGDSRLRVNAFKA